MMRRGAMLLARASAAFEARYFPWFLQQQYRPRLIYGPHDREDFLLGVARLRVNGIARFRVLLGRYQLGVEFNFRERTYSDWRAVAREMTTRSEALTDGNPKRIYRARAR